MMPAHQASCVAINGRGLLIEGPPGSGKSSLALALIDRGATLIGDDGVLLEPRNGSIIAMPHPNTSGLLEIRNLGLVPMAVCAEAPLHLIIALTAQAPRYIESADQVDIEGCTMPRVLLWPDSPVLALRAEFALERFGLPPGPIPVRS